MCHLMPQRHLPEWREEDERAFVQWHLDIHGQLHLHEVTIMSQTTFWKALWKTRLDVIAWFIPGLTVYKMTHATAIPSGHNFPV